MKNIEKLTLELANELRRAKLNFVIAIEDGGIQSQFSAEEGSKLHSVIEVLKEID